MEAWRFKMEPWRAYRPVVSESYHIWIRLKVEKQDPDPHIVEIWIRIRIEGMRIRNLV